jgi:hypothetical protein
VAPNKEPEKVVLPVETSFISPAYMADTWSTSIILQYFVEKLDLPQYYESVNSLSLTGIDLLSFHPELELPAGFTFTHSLHRTKVLAHCARLREAVFKRVVKDRELIKEQTMKILGKKETEREKGHGKQKDKEKEKDQNTTHSLTGIEEWSVIEVATWLAKDKVIANI